MAVDLRELRKRMFSRLYDFKRGVEEKSLQVYGRQVLVSFQETYWSSLFWERVALEVKCSINGEDFVVFGVKKNGHWRGRLVGGGFWCREFILGRRICVSDEEDEGYIPFSLVPSFLTHGYFLTRLYNDNRPVGVPAYDMSLRVGCTKNNDIIFRFLSVGSYEAGIRKFILSLVYGETDVVVSLLRERFIDEAPLVMYSERLKHAELGALEKHFGKFATVVSTMFL